MKKRGIGFLAVLLAVLLCFPAAVGEIQASPETRDRVRNADSVSWAGGNLVLLNGETGGELVSLETNATVLTSVSQIAPGKDSVLAMTEDNTVYEVDREGRTSAVLLPGPHVDGSSYELQTRSGIALLRRTSGCYVTFRNLKTGAAYTLERNWADDEYPSADIWQGSPEEECYIVVAGRSSAVVCRGNGTLLWEKNVRLVYNHEFGLVTDGLLAGYRAEDGAPVILDLASGEEKASFEPGWYWRMWDAQCQVFHDHTAILDWGEYSIERSMIVCLDGRRLITAPAFIYDRYPLTPYQVFLKSMEDGSEQYLEWNPQAGTLARVTTDTEGTAANLEMVISPDQVPEVTLDGILFEAGSANLFADVDVPVTFDWLESGFVIRRNDGTILGGQVWQELLSEGDSDGVGYGSAATFAKKGRIIVRAQDGKWGIMSLDGSMLLPAVFDSLEPAAWYAAEDTGFIAKQDGETILIGADYQPVFSTGGN